jgi:phenylalanyl-tRNA synthetase beta chain
MIVPLGMLMIPRPGATISAMPVIGISVEQLHRLLKLAASAEQVETWLNQLGCDVDGVVEVIRYKSKHSDKVIEVLPSEALPLTDDVSGVSTERATDLWELLGGETVVRLDLLPVRPDLFDAGGLARALRGYLGRETGLKDYSATAPTWRVDVDARLADPRFKRPLIQCAIIRNLTIDDETLRAIMKLQENLHWALCRDRKFASLGAYDLDTLSGPVNYTLVSRDEFRFTPLFWGRRDPVSPGVMLSEHPKGKAYAHLVEGLELLPALIDAQGQVLSLPPVINSDETKVTTRTRNLFLDVTGCNLPVVTRALAILATSIVELDPSGQAQLERVEIKHYDHTEATPALVVEEFRLDPERAARTLGLELSRADCAGLLEQMRYGASDPGGTEPLTVRVPAYRNDIMHEVDLIEDLAIAYGYHNITPALVPSFTIGRALPLNQRTRLAAQVLTGLGYLETLSLVLTNERDHYERMLRETPERRAEVQNPASVEQTMLREHLYSPLLAMLARNTDHPLPQRIFEAGDVVTYRSVPAEQPRPQERRVVAAALCAVRAGYASGRSVLDALLSELKLAGEYRAVEHPSAIPGRSAEVAGADGHVLAEVFEVHPEVLELWKISNPVVLLSLDLGPVEYH